MALTTALNMALLGMMNTEVKTNLSSQNITNADKEGYTRKSLNTTYLTTNVGSAPVSGVVVGASDPFLIKAAIGDISTYSYNSTVSNSLSYYATQLGHTDGSNTLSSYLDQMYANLKYLATSPEIAANKAEVVSTASNLANSIRNLSGDIQNLRLSAEQQIAGTIDDINASLDRIDVLNDKIAQNPQNDASLAEYEDQRNLELQKLASNMDIQYFYTSNNVLQIYTGSGQSLLLSDPHHINYAVTNSVDATTIYPASFSPMSVGGTDITTSITGGKLAGLIELRDQTYVSEQSKLDELSNVLKTQINTVLNTGASVPPRTNITGSLSGLTAGTAFTATGSIRVAVTDQSGTIVNYSDINLAAMTSVNDVLTALNGVAGLSASLTANGELSITASPSTNGVVFNPLNSAVTSSTGQSFSQYFGLNDLFTGTNAQNIRVSSVLEANPEYLSISSLSSSATLAVGDRGVARGDGSVADLVANALTATQSFANAGNFAAQSNTLQRYAQAYMSNAATQASISQSESDTAYQTYKASTDLMTSASGVNIDEETAKMLILQNQYKAAAQVVSTIQDMLDALINAVR